MGVVVEESEQTEQEHGQLALFARLRPSAQAVSQAGQPAAGRQHGKQRPEEQHHRQDRQVRPAQRARLLAVETDERVDRLHEGVEQVAAVQNGQSRTRSATNIASTKFRGQRHSTNATTAGSSASQRNVRGTIRLADLRSPPSTTISGSEM